MLGLAKSEKSQIQDVKVWALGWLLLQGYVLTLLGAFCLDRFLNQQFYMWLGPIDLDNNLLLQVLVSISDGKKDFFHHHILPHIPIN